MAYGPRQRPNKLVPYLALSLLQGKEPVIKSADRYIDWVFVDDVVEGILAAVVASGVEGRTIDLGTGVTTSVREVAARLVAITCATVVPRFEEGSALPCNNDRVADLAQAERWLQWRPKTSLQEGLAHTAQWYKAELAQAASV